MTIELFYRFTSKLRGTSANYAQSQELGRPWIENWIRPNLQEKIELRQEFCKEVKKQAGYTVHVVPTNL